MVALNKNNQNNQAAQAAQPQNSAMADALSGAMGQQQQSQEGIPSMKPNATTRSVFDFLNADMSSLADGTSGERAAAVLAKIKEYREAEKSAVPAQWQTDVILSPELPNGEMLLIYVVIENEAYVHPVIFPEKGGLTRQAAQSVNGMMGMVQETKDSSASIARIGGFKQILLSHIQSRGFNVKAVTDIAVCGCTLYHAGNDIKVNNLLANASNEAYSVIAAKHTAVNPNVRNVADFAGTEIIVDSKSNAEKRDIHGEHKFAPVVISGTARTKSTLEGNYGFHNTVIGEVSGFMDFVPYAPQQRLQEQMRRQQANNPQRVPSHKPFFVITDEEWANFKGGATTPENLLTLFMLLPSIADGALWIPRVVNSKESGFNALYDFASVGYDEEGFNAAFEECHVAKTFNLAAMRKYAQDYFSNVTICMDVALSGPNAGAIGLISDAAQLNRLIYNLTGQNLQLQSVGQQLGRIPLGTYDYQGKKRDIRELLNYYSWAKFVNGDKAQLQRWHQWFVAFGGQNENVVFAERCKMADEISNGTFELKDTALRLIIDDKTIMSIRQAFVANGVNIKTAQNAVAGADAGYGFTGGFDGGMQQQQQNSFMGMGSAIQGGNVW